MYNKQNSIRLLLIAVCSFFITGIANGQSIKKVKITDVEKIIAESKSPLIVNFWATWCVPCIEELPYLLEEVKNHQQDSLTILLVSLDFEEAFPKAISTFAKKRKIYAPIVWLDETNADYFCPKVSKDWSGAIPATLFVNNAIGFKKFIEGQISQQQLKQIIVDALGK